MNLSHRIDADLKEAMRARDLVKLGVLRMLKSALKYAAIEKPGTAGELDDPETTKGWAEKSDWKGLEIVSTDKGGTGDDQGMVEFKAHFAFEGEDKEHHETATFKKMDGRWYYVDGQVKGPAPVQRDEPKVGRNDPCPCGSGKKFKKCCGNS